MPLLGQGVTGLTNADRSQLAQGIIVVALIIITIVGLFLFISGRRR